MAMNESYKFDAVLCNMYITQRGDNESVLLRPDAMQLTNHKRVGASSYLGAKYEIVMHFVIQKDR